MIGNETRGEGQRCEKRVNTSSDWTSKRYQRISKDAITVRFTTPGEATGTEGDVVLVVGDVRGPSMSSGQGWHQGYGRDGGHGKHGKYGTLWGGA